jgi:DNA helicase-2/ATP-dependent DNA helicase PcrA
MEEERRLCYVGMTRAEKRLYLTWARYRRRFGGGEQERSLSSRFLKEVPPHLMINVGADAGDEIPQIDLTAERYDPRQSAKRNVYTGKTYNSLDNISTFFKKRGIQMPVQTPVTPPSPSRAQQFPPRAPASAPIRKPVTSVGPAKAGTVVEHPKYGIGTVVRREGEGDDAKITVMFARHGLKKLIEKYAGITKK